MAGPYRGAFDWSLLSEHRVSTAWRTGLLVAGGAGLVVAALLLRAMFFGPRAEAASTAVGAWATLVLLLALDAFLLFAALRASEGRVTLHREGVVLDGVLGRCDAMAWADVARVGRLRTAGRGGERVVGWALHHNDRSQLMVPSIYAGAGEALERLATLRGLQIVDERS